VTRLRISLLALAALAALALLAVWLVPQWLNWTRYRATIEVLASATLGQPVTIQGPITLTLLPQPVLTAAQVNVGGTGSTDMSIHVDALRLRVALWPLIGGRVDARELVLRGADLRILWPGEPGKLLARPPAWLAAFTARIENGRLTLGRLAFTGIDATLATLETGALSMSGTAQFSGHSWHVVARLTAAGADGAAGLNVALDGQGDANGLGASFSGQLAADGTLAGSINSRGPNLAVLLPAPPVPFHADGRLTVGSGLAAIDELALEIGGSPATGAIALRVTPQQRLDIALSASRLDLDAWLPVLLGAGTTIAGIDIPIGLDLSAQAAPLAGSTLEHLRATFELAGKALTVRDASVLLPGNGQLRAAGRVVRDDPSHARFEGDAKLDAPVLRTTLRWMEGAAPSVLPANLVAALPDAVLLRAALSAHMMAGMDEVSLNQLGGSVDDAPVAGSISFKRGEPPSIIADLTVDRMSLDPWLPKRLPSPTELVRIASGFDANLHLGIHQASLAGGVVQGIAIDATMEAGGLALRRVEATVSGVHAIASGSLDRSGQVSDGTLSVTTEDATPLAALVPSAWRATPALWQGSAKLSVHAAGPPNALGMGIELSLAGTRLEAEPTIDLRSGAWTGTVTLRHPGARRFLATIGIPEELGLPELPAWLGDGSLSLQAHLAGSPGRLTAESFDVTAAVLHAGGKLVLDGNGSEPYLSGRFRVDALPLPIVNGGSEVPLPIGLLHGWRGDVQLDIGQVLENALPILRDATCGITVADNVLRIDRFTSKLGDGTLTGGLTFDAADKPPSLAVQAQLTNATISGPLADTPLDLLSGRASGKAELSASGYSPAAILATLGGRLALTVTDGAVDGFDLSRAKLAAENPDAVAAQSAASDALALGVSAFDRLDVAASVAHGYLSLDAARLRGSGGIAEATGGMNLATRMLDLRIALRPALPDPPEIAIRLTGPMDHPVRTPELASLARFVAERAR
jgi:AsmA-like C-terminal region/AsmA family